MSFTPWSAKDRASFFIDIDPRGQVRSSGGTKTPPGLDGNGPLPLCVFLRLGLRFALGFAIFFRLGPSNGGDAIGDAAMGGTGTWARVIPTPSSRLATCGTI
jgi:hypothetical protein